MMNCTSSADRLNVSTERESLGGACSLSSHVFTVTNQRVQLISHPSVGMALKGLINYGNSVQNCVLCPVVLRCLNHCSVYGYPQQCCGSLMSVEYLYVDGLQWPFS